jgi:hypothetical protein
MVFSYFLGKDQLKYGLELLGFTTSFDYTNSVQRKIEQTENTSEIAGFVNYKVSRKKMIIEPGFRIQYYASLSHLSPEPRLAFKFLANNHLRFKMAAGAYSQNLIAANSDRDVVNLFYGFVSGSGNLPDTVNGKLRKHNLQKAQHVILGCEYDVVKNISLNLEVYYKYFSQLTNINRNKIFEDKSPYNDPSSISYKPENLRKDFIVETGNALGFDVSMKYDQNNLYIWLVYSLAYVDRYDGSSYYFPHYLAGINSGRLISGGISAQDFLLQKLRDIMNSLLSRKVFRVIFLLRMVHLDYCMLSTIKGGSHTITGWMVA